MPSENNKQTASQKLPLPEEKILAIAHKEIESMGYRVAEYKFEIAKKEHQWEVHYFPVQKKSGYVTMGGGFSIYLKEDGTIEQVLLNQ